MQGNLLLDYLLGAEVRFAPDNGSQRRLMDELAAREREAGRRPHILNDNPMFDVASALAYIECTMEIQEELQRDGLAATHLYMSSSGKGQAGQILYRRLFDQGLAVHGVSATDEFDDIPARTAAIANRTAQTLALDLEVAPAEVVNFDGYVGAGYGIPSPAAIEALGLLARTEGVVLDPVYTGKAAAALIDHVREGRLGQGDVVVFVVIFTHHTIVETGLEKDTSVTPSGTSRRH